MFISICQIWGVFLVKIWVFYALSLSTPLPWNRRTRPCMRGPDAAGAGTPTLPTGLHRPLALELREISINANAGYSKLLHSDVTRRKCRSQSSARIGVAVLNRDMSTCPVIFTAMLATRPLQNGGHANGAALLSCELCTEIKYTRSVCMMWI